jgi:hypothetical protein
MIRNTRQFQPCVRHVAYSFGKPVPKACRLVLRPVFRRDTAAAPSKQRVFYFVAYVRNAERVDERMSEGMKHFSGVSDSVRADVAPEPL